MRFEGKTDTAAKIIGLNSLGESESDVDIEFIQHASGALFWHKNAIIDIEVKKEVLEARNKKAFEEEQRKEEEKRLQIEAEERRRREEAELRKKKAEGFINEFKNAAKGFPWMLYSPLKFIKDASEDYTDMRTMLIGVGTYFIDTYIDDNKLHLDKSLICSLIKKYGFNNRSMSETDNERMEGIWNTIVEDRVFQLLGDKEYFFTMGQAFGDYFNSDQTSGVATFDAFILFLMARDYRRARYLFENTELRTIIKSVYARYPNATRGSAFLEVNGLRAREDRDNTLFKIYEDDYKDEIPYSLDLTAFIELCDIVDCVQNECEMDSIADDLVNNGYNLKNIVSECIANEQSIYSKYKELIKEGFFDEMFSNSVSQRLIYELLVYTNYLVLDSMNMTVIANTWSDFIDAELMFNSALQKYFALHPEAQKNNAVECINEAYKNASTGVDFENVLKLLYEYLGCSVETTKTSGDQGADLVVVKDGHRSVVQAKYYSGNVGNKAVQEVVAAMKVYDAEKGIVVTNSHFTRQAVSLAEANNVELVDGEKLEKMIKNV